MNESWQQYQVFYVSIAGIHCFSYRQHKHSSRRLNSQTIRHSSAMRSSDNSASDRAAVQPLITNILSDSTNTLLLFIYLFSCVSPGGRVTPAHIPALVIGKKKDNTAFMRWGERGRRHWASFFLWTKERCITAWLNDDQGGRLSETSAEKKKRCVSGRAKALFSQRTSSAHALNSQLWRTSLLQDCPFYEVNRNLAHNTYTKSVCMCVYIYTYTQILG